MSLKLGYGRKNNSFSNKYSNNKSSKTPRQKDEVRNTIAKAKD